MKKSIFLIILLFISSVGYADSLQRFINRYSDVDGAQYKVFNRDSHFNDVPANSFSPFSLKMRSGSLKVMGIEEMVILQLEQCRESVQERFVENVTDAIPDEYSLVAENIRYQIYLSNQDEDYAYMLIVNHKLPGLTLMYVTNGFVRAMLNDEGDGFDPDKLERYLEQGAERLGESMINLGEKIKEGMLRLQESTKERVEEAETWKVYF
ncbi:MAG: hypothetical protein IKT86_03540 [Bacteroidaceae bacterium]|nr:hypothetical protein [Bacteroidaceae bacterium]